MKKEKGKYSIIKHGFGFVENPGFGMLFYIVFYFIISEIFEIYGINSTLNSYDYILEVVVTAISTLLFCIVVSVFIYYYKSWFRR